MIDSLSAPRSSCLHATDCVELDIRGRVPARIRVHPWSRGLLVERYGEDGWEPLEGDPKLFDLLAEPAPRPAQLASIRDGIPERALSTARRFHTQGLSLLRMLATPQGEELVDTAPTLAWLVAARLAEGVDSGMPIADLVRRPRRKLLAFALNMEDCSASMVRSVARLQVHRYDDARLVLLRLLVANPFVLSAAARVGRWDTRDLHLLLRYPMLPKCRYAHELLDAMREGDPFEMSDAWRVQADTLGLAEALGHPSPALMVASVPTLAALYRLHDRLLERHLAVNPMTAEQAPALPTHLPEPPFPEDGTIEPLLRPEDYVEEGRRMQHCVGTYVEAAARGECAVYRMTEPERATIEIDLVQGTPVLGQIRGPRNRKVGRDTVAMIEQWFERSLRRRS